MLPVAQNLLGAEGILTSQVCVLWICLVGITHHSGDMSYDRKSLIHMQIFVLSFTSFHYLL